MKICLSINLEQGLHLSQRIRKLLRQAAKQTLVEVNILPTQIKAVEISLLITDDAAIKELNRAYRGKDMATDVLSFAMTEGEDGNFATEGNLLLGDIVISMQRAAEQGEKYGHSTEREAVFLFIHGLLHLLGYDHERGVEEEQEMFAVQERIIQFIYE